MKIFKDYSDQELLDEIKLGDDQAMDFLLNRYGGLVQRVQKVFSCRSG